VKAILLVMKNVRGLAKRERNKQEGYDFASTDAFYDMLRPIMVEAGLIILQDEVSTEIIEGRNKDGKESLSLRAVYNFTYAHESGAIYGPLRRTVTVYRTAAQSFGSAQSYALKYFMRGEFKIPTGDKDDEDTQSESLASVNRGNRQRDDLEKEAERIRNALKGCKTIEALDGTMASNGIQLERIRERSSDAHTYLLKVEQTVRDRLNIAAANYEAEAQKIASEPRKPSPVSPELVNKTTGVQ